MTSIFEGQPPEQGLFQQKRGSFGFQVYNSIYIYIYACIFLYPEN